MELDDARISEKGGGGDDGDDDDEFRSNARSTDLAIMAAMTLSRQERGLTSTSGGKSISKVKDAVDAESGAVSAVISGSIDP